MDESRARRVAKRRGLIVLLGALLIVAAAVVARARSAELSDWYADFAAQHLTESLSSFALTDTDLGAFFFCARQVARGMDGRHSVETFQSPTESEVRELGDGRWLVISSVSEARADGAVIDHAFTCTVAYSNGRWRLEELTFR